LNYFRLKQLKPYAIIFILILIIVVMFHLFKSFIETLSVTHRLPALLLAGITNTDSDSARYMLSALVQSEAAIIAVVITLSLVAVQLAASSYSPRIIKIFIKSWDLRIVLLSYAFSIIYGLAVLRLVEGNINNTNINNLDWGISVAFVLGIFNLAILYPYITNTLRLITPHRIIKTLSEEITKDTVLSTEHPGDENDRFQDVINIIISSLMRFDVATVDDGLKSIEDKTKFVLKSYSASKDKEKLFADIVFYHLYNVAKLAISRDDETATLAVMHCIKRIGKFAIEQKNEDVLSRAIDSLREIGLLSARRKLRDTTSDSSNFLKDIGLAAFELGLNEFVCLVLYDIGDIGEIAANEELSEAVWTVVENLGLLGIRTMVQDPKDDTDIINSPTDIAIECLESVGVAAAKEDLLYAEEALMDSFGSIGVMATQKINKNDVAQNWALNTISSLETVGIEVVERRLDDAASQAGINLRRIGLEAIKQEIVELTTRTMDSLAKIGDGATNRDLERTPINIVMDITEIGVTVATKKQFEETKQKAISYLEKIKTLANEKNQSRLSSQCDSSIDRIKTSKDGRMYQFEQEM